MSHRTLPLVIGIIAILLLAFAYYRFILKAKKKDPSSFKEKWVKLQKLCGNKKTWPNAIFDADSLLDEALKKTHFKGKTMGERLVSAQHSLTDNDRVWFAHKLRNQLELEPGIKLKKRDVQDALVGIRQALKDLKVI